MQFYKNEIFSIINICICMKNIYIFFIFYTFRSELPKDKEKEKEKENEKEREKEKNKEKSKEKIMEKEKEKEKEKEEDKVSVRIAGTVNNTETLNAKHLGRQKHVEQITITAASPVSPCQVITVTNSDHSSSPALSSSISSQIISMENGQQTGGLPISSQPLITTPTIERLLPIGTIIRATGKQFILPTIHVSYIAYVTGTKIKKYSII